MSVLSPTLTHLGYVDLSGYRLGDNNRKALLCVHFDPLSRRLYVVGSGGEEIVILEA